MLIFNEILECRFWGLNKDLKRNINTRQDVDYNVELLDKLDDDNDTRYSDRGQNSEGRNSDGS